MHRSAKKKARMNTITKSRLLLGFISLTIWSCSAQTAESQVHANEVVIVGAMKNVMRLGQLEGTISLDTIPERTHLYGLGPMEFLKGELMIVDGHSYRSQVVNDTVMQVEASFAEKAPFFVYANVASWSSQPLPRTVRTTAELEIYLNKITRDAPRPFAFRLVGKVKTASIHIVNLPDGSKVSSPEEAHRGQKNYPLTNETVEIVGFFSTEHQAIFTHHDSFVHMHLINESRTKMGHVDDLIFSPSTMTLLLPKE
jgi:acetolactate decarboxylase